MHETFVSTVSSTSGGGSRTQIAPMIEVRTMVDVGSGIIVGVTTMVEAKTITILGRTTHLLWA